MIRKLFHTSLAALLACVLFVGSILSAACGPPSKKTIEKLHAGSVVVMNVLDVNVSLPDQLLAEKIINIDQYETVRKFISEARAGAAKVESGLAAALTIEKPTLKALAPIVADIIAQLRGLNAFIKHEQVQKLFGAAEIGLRVLGSYFALQVSEARGLGLSDRQMLKAAGFKPTRQNMIRFDLLATAYDGSRFEEWAAAL